MTKRHFRIGSDVSGVGVAFLVGELIYGASDATAAEPDSDPKNPKGWIVFVAIADVAHFVKPGSALDKGARERSNSVYFPDRVIPMLPEKLSNDLCSLKPDTERTCLAVRMRFDKDGKKIGHTFIRGLMKSAARLTYQQAQNAIDGQPNQQEQRRDQRRQVKSDLDRRLPFLDFAKQITISALHGTAVGDLLPEAEKAYRAATRDLQTKDLNKVLEEAVIAHAPPLVRGRRIKLRYAHQGGRNPPVIVIHGNQVEKLPEAYRRYLINKFRKIFHLKGTPVRLSFKTSENPFKGRRNKLTPRQLQKRKRLMKHVKR